MHRGVSLQGSGLWGRRSGIGATGVASAEGSDGVTSPGAADFQAQVPREVRHDGLGGLCHRRVDPVGGCGGVRQATAEVAAEAAAALRSNN